MEFKLLARQSCFCTSSLTDGFDTLISFRYRLVEKCTDIRKPEKLFIVCFYVLQFKAFVGSCKVKHYFRKYSFALKTYDLAKLSDLDSY